MLYDLKYLSVPLPEDVLKMKGFGDMERAKRIIELKLKNESLPFPLRQRLLLEKEILNLWPRAYPHDKDTALKQLRDCFGDFSETELDSLVDQDAVEWAYINGDMHFKNNFLNNLIKTRPAYAERVKDEKRRENMRRDAEYDQAVMERMINDGSLNARFHMHAQMTIDPVPSREGQKVYAHLPLPKEYAQVKNVQILRVSHPQEVTLAPADYPQRTICFHAIPDRPFEVEYTFETHMRYVEADPAKALPQQPSFYTEEYAPHILFTPYLRMLCREIVGPEQNPLGKARKIYDFITTKMIYSFMRPYMTMPNVPEYGATSMKGDCGVQALLFITLCRIAGVPARWQSGLYIKPNGEGEHDWAQFYVAPYGWLFADCSFGGGAYRHGNRKRWNFYFGNLDPFRLPANSEYQHDFFVPFRHLRYDPYDNQDGDAEYEDERVPYSAIDTTQKVLSMELF